MRPIALSRPLTLEASQTVADGAGGFSLAWQALGTLWAEMVAGTGREAAGEEVTLSTVAYRITVRAAPVGSTARPRRLRRTDRVGAPIVSNVFSVRAPVGHA